MKDVITVICNLWDFLLAFYKTYSSKIEITA